MAYHMIWSTLVWGLHHGFETSYLDLLLPIYIYIYVFPKCKQNAYVAISNVYIALSSRAGDVQGVDKFLLRAFIINYSSESLYNKLFKSFSLNCNRIVYVSVACFCLTTVEKMSSYLVWFIECWISFGSPSTSYFSLTQLSSSGRESTCLEHIGQERFGLYCSQKSFHQ